MMRRLRSIRSAAVTGVAIAALSGCGSGNPETAGVHGKVTFNGQPVPGGGLTFAPVAEGDSAESPGKPASAQIQQDGSYTLGTYDADDGAIVGKHTVTFQPPPPPGAADAAEDDPGDAHTPAPKPSEFAGLKPMVEVVEVVSGDNEINIELKK